MPRLVTSFWVWLFAWARAGDKMRKINGRAIKALMMMTRNGVKENTSPKRCNNTNQPAPRTIAGMTKIELAMKLTT